VSIRRTDSKDALPNEDSDQPRSDDESRLSRWSRRKRDLARPRSGSMQDAEDSATRSLSSDSLEDTSTHLPPAADRDVSGDLESGDADDEPQLTDADMPDIETLTPDSDFKPFMSQGVSHALRRKALRKLFASPFFQIRDGLDDYDDDFTSFAPLGDTVTADMKYAEERKEMLRREAEEAEAQRQRNGEQLASSDEPSQDNSEEDSTDDVSTETLQGDPEAAALAHDELGQDERTRPASATVSSLSSVRGGGAEYGEYEDDEEV